MIENSLKDCIQIDLESKLFRVSEQLENGYYDKLMQDGTVEQLFHLTNIMTDVLETAAYAYEEGLVDKEDFLELGGFGDVVSMIERHLDDLFIKIKRLIDCSDVSDSAKDAYKLNHAVMGLISATITAYRKGLIRTDICLEHFVRTE